MPPPTGLRMVARQTWFYNDAAPTELPGRADEGDRTRLAASAFRFVDKLTGEDLANR